MTTTTRTRCIVVEGVTFAPTWAGQERWRVDVRGDAPCYVWRRDLAHQLHAEAVAGRRIRVVLANTEDERTGRRWRDITHWMAA